jgi:hypothetical protein
MCNDEAQLKKNPLTVVNSVVSITFSWLWGCMKWNVTLSQQHRWPHALSRAQTYTAFWMLYAFFWVIPQRLNFIRRRFETLCSITSAYKIQTPGNRPKESIQQSLTSKKNEHNPQIKPEGSHVSVSHTMQDQRVVESSQKSTVITNNCFQDTGNQHGTIDCNPIELRKICILA